jgi:hypothetical protein
MRARALRTGWLLALAFAFSLPIFAAPSRTVTIVVERNGSPVADARVLIAADEMDAVGITDAQGRVTVTTTSARIQVVADKDGAKGTATGTTNTLTVALSGGAQ